MNPEPIPSSERSVARVSADAEQVSVHNNCWACGLPFSQDVLSSGAGSQELHWQCDSCDVSWMAIGSPSLTVIS